jgi:hypothetical protein
MTVIFVKFSARYCFCDFYRASCNSGYRGFKKKAKGIGDSDRDIPIDSSLPDLSASQSRHWVIREEGWEQCSPKLSAVAERRGGMQWTNIFLIKLIGLHKIPEFDYFGITIAQVLIYGGLVGRLLVAFIARSVLIGVHAKVRRVINNFEDVLGREF